MYEMDYKKWKRKYTICVIINVVTKYRHILLCTIIFTRLFTLCTNYLHYVQLFTIYTLLFTLCATIYRKINKYILCTNFEYLTLYKRDQ